MLTAKRGACAAEANSLIISSTRWRRGSVRWKALPSRSGSWAMCSSASTTQSTGTRFVLPRSGPDERRPLGQQLACALDRLEEVVRAVDLVHLAGARIADDDARAVDAPRHVGLLAHDPLGLELRAVVGRGELLALVEHLLFEGALVLAGDGDRGDVVQALGVDRARQFDGVRGAADVDGGVQLRRRRHVVHGREVEEVLDLAAQLGDLLLLDAEQRAAQVADHRFDAFARRRAGDDAPALDQVREALQRRLAHEHVDLALAFVEQLLDESTPDEAGRSCDEVGHRAAEPTCKARPAAGRACARCTRAALRSSRALRARR